MQRYAAVAAAALLACAGPRHTPASPLSLEVRGYGFVMAGLPATDPFYHASALLFVKPVLSIGRYITVPVRMAAEVWNFSKTYDDPNNLIVWAKPQFAANIPIGLLAVDSVIFRAGDLGRNKHGLGLALEYFEGQGADLSFYAGRVHLRARAIGVGWEGCDDIVSVELAFQPYLGLNTFVNVRNDPIIETNSVVLSLTAMTGRRFGSGLYGEFGVNVATGGIGGLVGADGSGEWGPFEGSAVVEYRHYGYSFFGTNRSELPRYFESLTALDKPVNRYDLYQRTARLHHVVSSELRLRLGLFGPWFIGGELEALVGTIDDVFYIGEAGVRVGEHGEITTGVMNKIFQLNEDEDGRRSVRMFRSRNAPLVLFSARVWF
jgi:hypothetical protein